MKRIVSIILPLLLISTQGGFTQRQLTLSECKEMAVENNNTLKERRIEVEMATQHDKELFTKFFPQVSAIGGYFSSTDPIASTDISTTTLPLPPLGLPPVLGVGLIEKGAVASLSAMQTIYGGGLVRNANRLTSVGVDVSRLQLDKSSDEVEMMTEEYYFQCVKLESKRRIIDSGLEQLRELRRHVESCVEAGVVTTNDLMRVDMELSSLESEEIKLKNGLILSKLLLAQYIGISSDSFEVTPLLAVDICDPQNYLVDFNEAVDSSNEVALLNKQIEARRLEVRLAQGERMPKIAVGGAYGYNNLLHKNNDYFVGMASVSVPLTGWWSGTHKVKRAKLKQQQSVIQYNDATEKLHLQMTQLYLNLTEKYQQVGVAQRRQAQGEENYRLNRELYDAGTITLTDLLEAQTLLRQSQDNDTEAQIDYQIALNQYLQKARR